MAKRLILLVAALLAMGVLVAGCGGDDEGDGGGDGTPAAQTETGGGDGGAETEAGSGDTGGGEESGSGGDSGAGAGANDEAVKQAVEACKQSVEGNAQLSEDVKQDLIEICEKAAEGDEEAVRDASIDVCRKIVEESVPSGPARDQALAACDQQQ